MNTWHILSKGFIAAGLLAGLVFAKSEIRIVTESTPLYVNESGSSNKGVLIAGDKMTFLERGLERSLIKTSDGLRGWVDNSELKRLDLIGAVYDLESIEVRSWLDNPHAIYIFDVNSEVSQGILLIRTFKDEIFEFVDRETMEMSKMVNHTPVRSFETLKM